VVRRKIIEKAMTSFTISFTMMTRTPNGRYSAKNGSVWMTAGIALMATRT